MTAGLMALIAIVWVVHAFYNPTHLPSSGTAEAAHQTYYNTSNTGATTPTRDIAATLNRPLQRPLYDPPKPKPEAPKPPPPPPPLQLRLIGAVIEPGRTQAIVMTGPSNAGQITFVGVGDRIADAQIQSIKPNQIEVLYHGQTRVLQTESE